MTEVINEFDTFPAPESGSFGSDTYIQPDLATIQERHPDWPELKLAFYFSAHGINKDMEGIKPHLQNADVLLYERVAMQEEDVHGRNREMNSYNNLSINPTVSLRRFLRNNNLKGDSDEILARGLYKSGKAVGTIDIGATEYDRVIAQETLDAFSMKLSRDMSYEHALDYFDDRSRSIAELTLEREAIMLGNFEEEMDRILYARPDLKEKDDLNILITMGSLHTTLGHSFRKAGMQSERHFAKAPTYRYAPQHQLIRTHLFGLEPTEKLKKQALADGMLNEMLQNMFLNRSVHYDDFSAYTTKVTTVMTEDELEGLYDTWSHQGDTRMYMDGVLRNHGMDRLARSNRDIKKFADKRAKPRKRLAKAAFWLRNKR